MPKWENPPNANVNMRDHHRHSHGSGTGVCLVFVFGVCVLRPPAVSQNAKDGGLCVLRIVIVAVMAGCVDLKLQFAICHNARCKVQVQGG